MLWFDNIIYYLTPSAKKRGPVDTGGVKKLISYERKIMSYPCPCLNSVISTWHFLSKHNEPMTKKILILGYFEAGRCKIVLPKNYFLKVKHIFALTS